MHNTLAHPSTLPYSNMVLPGAGWQLLQGQVNHICCNVIGIVVFQEFVYRVPNMCINV